MYMGSCGCSGGKLGGLAAGTGAAIGTVAGTAYGGPVGGAIGGAIGGQFDGGGSSGGGSGSSGGGSAPPSQAVSTYTSTNVNTQVSPQISPNFIQQQQPTNSGVNASTSQMLPAMPGTPVTGAIPGIDNAHPYNPAGYMQTSGVDVRLLALGAAGVLLVALLAGRRKRNHQGR